MFVPGRPITNVDSTALYDLGRLYFDFNAGNVYRYVEGDAALSGDTCADKQVVAWMDDGWEINNDVNVGLGVTACAGVCISAITEAAFGWIQISGMYDVLTDGGVTAADPLVIHSVDGEADTMADGEEEQVFGVALETDHETIEECGFIFRGIF